MPAYDIPVKALIAWATRPTERPEWEDVSAYLLKIPQSIRRGRNRVSTRFEAGDVRLILDNIDRRFEPGYISSPYYPDVKTTKRVRVCQSWTAAITDNFNRADTPNGSGFQLGTATTGQAWTGSTGNSPTLAPQWYISSNRATMGAYTGVYHQHGYAIQNPGTSNVAVKATFVGLAKRQAIVWRWASSTSFWLVRTADNYASYQVYFWSGSYALIGTVASVTPTAGDVLEVIADGPNHYIYVNDVLGLTLTNTTNQTATRHGIGHHNDIVTADVPLFDDFRLESLPVGSMFDGYIESIDAAYDLESTVEITAVDGFKALNLIVPAQAAGIYDLFNRTVEDEEITTADSGQSWTATGLPYTAKSGHAVVERASRLRDDFTTDSGARPNWVDDNSIENDPSNLLELADATDQEWVSALTGNWCIYGPGAGEDYAFVADWLIERAFYEDPGSNADVAGFYKVGIDPGGVVHRYYGRIDLTDATNRATATTGPMMGFYFFGDATTNNYWAFMMEERTLAGTVDYGCTLVRVVNGVPTFSRKYADIWPGGPNNPVFDSSYNFGGDGIAGASLDVMISLVDDKIRVELVGVDGGIAIDTTLTRVADKPTGGFLPGYQCGLIHNGVTRLDGTSTAQNWNKWLSLTAIGPTLLVLESGLADCDVEAIIKTTDSRLGILNVGQTGKGVAFRYTDDNNFWFSNWTGDGAGSPSMLYLWKVVNGSYYQMGSHNFGATYPPAQYSFTDRTLNNLRVSLDGSAIVVSWGGVTYITVTDEHNRGATKHGLYHGNAILGTTEMDDVDWPNWDTVPRGHDEFRIGRPLNRQLSGERVDVLLDVVGWRTQDRDIAAGTVYLAPMGSSLDLDPKSALEHINAAVDAEHGAFYFSADGKAVFEDRHTRLSLLTAEAVFDDTGATGLKYLPGVRLRIDDANMYNEVKITPETSESEYFSGVLTDGSYRGFFDTGETAAEPPGFQVKYTTRTVTLTGATYVYVKMYDAPGPYGPWTARTDLDSPRLVSDDEAVVSVLTATQRYKRFQLSWDAGTVSVDLDVSMTSTPVEQVAVDEASIDDHFRRTYGPQTVPLSSNDDAKTLAELILSDLRESQPRIERLAVAPTTQADADDVMALDISSRVQVLVHMPDGSPYFSQIGFVEGLEYEFGEDSVKTTLSLSQQNAGINGWVLDDPILSVLGTTTRLS